MICLAHDGYGLCCLCSRCVSPSRSSLLELNNRTTCIMKCLTVSVSQVCESSPVELNVVAFGQWNLARPAEKERMEVAPPLRQEEDNNNNNLGHTPQL